MNLEVERISKEEVRENMKSMKNVKAVGPGDLPVEIWKCLGESVLDFLTKLYNRTMESERMRGVERQRSDTHFQERGAQCYL